MSGTESDNETEDIHIEQVADPEEYINQRRLKDIYDAKRELLKSRREASRMKINAKHGGSAEQFNAAAELHREAAENYFLEISSLFHRNEAGREIWYQRDFGTVTIQPPYTAQNMRPCSSGGYKIDDPNSVGDIWVISIPEPKEVELVGIESLFTLPSPVTKTFEYVVDEGHYGEVPREETNSGYVSKSTLDRMVKIVDLYLDELGLDLDEEQGLPEDELKL
jgi:hypothetical protein